jgi:predicted dehydrogenase
MDYIKQPLGFRIRKAIRSVAMFGPGRTYINVMGQRHMRRSYEHLPPQIGGQNDRQTVGIIGCGNYSFSVIAYFLHKEFGDVIASCMDKDINRAASYASHYKVPYYTDKAEEIISNPQIRLIYIASNHASHAEYAIKALEAGKDVYIEKPHVVSVDQLLRLNQAMQNYNGKVFLGFNRPGSRFGQMIKNTLAAKDGPAVINWFVIGHYLGPGHWYLRDGEGGRVLGNLCHWTDYTLRLISGNPFPITIIPVRQNQNDQDMAVNLIFGDGTIATITFTGQGYTFEGVRECFRAQKGDIIVAMDDFKYLLIEIMTLKKKFINYHHDPGHRNNIVSSFKNAHENARYDRQSEISHILNTAWLFLNTKEAMETNERLTIGSFEVYLEAAGANRKHPERMAMEK